RWSRPAFARSGASRTSSARKASDAAPAGTRSFRPHLANTNNNDPTMPAPSPAKAAPAWRKPLILSAALVALAAAGYGAWTWYSKSNGAPAYRLAKVERGAIQAVVSASGTLQAVTTVQVGSQISGQIKEIL